jgi:hypothetical protein
MRLYENETFHGLTPRWLFSPRTIGDFEFRRCFFDNCNNFPASKPSRRQAYRNIVLTNCTNGACSLSTAIVENVTVNGLRTRHRRVFFTWATVFKHVVLKGKLNSMILNQVLRPGRDKKQKLWDEANREFYATVDWALDISEAEFTFGISLHAVPGSLIRRDPETQVLVSKKTALQSSWQDLPWGKSALRLALQWFLEDSLYEDVVLVASKRGVGYRDDLEAVRMLRREGVAGPD